MFIAFSGCSSDNDSEPEQMICPNGFTGSDCSTKLTPSKIFINKVVIQAFPGVTPSGELWDTGEDTSEFRPDLLILIKQGTAGTPIYITPLENIKVDANPSSDYTFTISPGLVITQPLDLYGIEVGDFDGSIESSDLMVNKSFNVYDAETNGFPSFITITDAATTFQAQIYLSYVW